MNLKYCPIEGGNFGDTPVTFRRDRPVAPATLRVSDALATYARVDAHFACSTPTHIAQQRQRMLDACARFAQDYGLRFTP